MDIHIIRKMENKVKQSVVLVTGGAGFIGSYVVEELINLGAKKIFIIDNLIRGSLKNMEGFVSNPTIVIIKEDIRNLKVLEDVIKECDYVFHMAALRINACAADQDEGFEVMIKSTFDIAKLCVKYKIKKVIYSSSASIYGLAQHFPTPESDNPYDNQTFYGSAKLWGEQLFRSFKFMHNLDYVALRYFNVYGARMDTDGKYTEVMIKWLNCIKSNKPPEIYGDGSTTMDFIYVSDIAKANIAALQSDITDEAFNVGNSIEVSLKELLDILLEVNFSNLKPVFKAENTVNPVNRRLASIEKAKLRLGFEPEIDLRTGLRILSTWYFEKGHNS